MNQLNKINPLDLKNINKLNEIRMKRAGNFKFTNEIESKLNPELNSSLQRKNSSIEDKKIVNNKPSQFGPVLGVNFHMIKK